AQERPLRFQRGRHQQVFSPALQISSTNPAQAPPKPGVGQRAVNGHRLLKPPDRFADSILCGRQESLQGERLRVARLKYQTPSERLDRLAGATETELQLREARPAETEIGRLLDRLPRRFQGLGQIGLRLLIV